MAASPAAETAAHSPDVAPAISIVIPALDEAGGIGATLAALRAQGGDFEILVVDGGSSDQTVAIASAAGADRVIHAPRGRARQMNAGAALARGEWLLFLHADTLLPPDALLDIQALPRDVAAGGFRHRFSGGGAGIAAVSWLTNLRCRLTGIVYGDQAFFIRRSTFETIDGFPEGAPLEDVAICRRLKQQRRPRLMETCVVTDARKFRQRGVLRCMAEVIVILACERLGLPMPRLGFFRAVR